MKIAVSGRIHTGSYTNSRTGQKVYTTDVIIDEHEFCESNKNANGTATPTTKSNAQTDKNGFMHIPDNVDDDLPFN